MKDLRHNVTALTSGGESKKKKEVKKHTAKWVRVAAGRQASVSLQEGKKGKEKKYNDRR